MDIVTTKPEVTAKAKREGIALCLSGGGYRAALFHLGATRRLHELGILPKVRSISAVSGGSIFAAFLAAQMVKLGLAEGLRFQDWEKQVAQPFRAFVQNDLRTAPFLLHLPWNWLWPQGRVKHLERLYRKHLTDLTLGQLPERPCFIFCATDLTFGVNWLFERTYAGSYQTGYLSDVAHWPLARAVAASSCFPPIFGPMQIATRPADFRDGNYRRADRDALLARIRLSDGGVYDNLGQQPVIRNHEYILVSDCGAPFGFASGGNPLRRLLRYTSVVTNQVEALRKQVFYTGLSKGWHKGAYWSLRGFVKSEEAGFHGYGESSVRDYIARIRTDLDFFSAEESGILENHGYHLTERRIRAKTPELIVNDTPAVTPHPALVAANAVAVALKSSHRRMSLRRAAQSIKVKLTKIWR